MPPATVVTTPVPGAIIATRVLLLLQVPPGTSAVKVVVEPAHKMVVPIIVEAGGTIVTVAVLAHDEVRV